MHFGLVAQGFQHGIGDIGIGFKAARANVGADGGPYIGRIAAEGTNHGSDGFSSNIRGSAAPAGMDSAHRPGYRVMEQYGGAVGGKN